MDLRRWPHADRLLEEALALDASSRQAFVRAAAGEDDALRGALEAILEEAERSDSFLSPGGALSGVLAADLGRAEDPPNAARSLTPGMNIGGYEVVALAGRGGMGEVYKARDARLARLVALKILPDRFARDPERLARFEREARVLASLNHARIGGIHGIAEDSDTRALVLEWVEGQTLADRLRTGPLSIRDALAIAMQIGEALEAAHQRAIVHRDLKPSNIKLTADGAKVLDFGLARAAGPTESGEDPVSSVFARPGIILGTPAYMSPEQAQGLRVDHRADIWAFGCVLAEMLTGRQAFGGPSTAAVLTRVLEGTPDLERLPPETPPSVRTLLERCLDKDPRRRLGWIGEAVLVMESAATPPPVPSPAATIRRWWARTWPVAGGLALGVVTALVATPLFEREPAPPVARLAVLTPPGDALVAGDLPTVAVSPDGRRIVYRARRDGTMQLFLRALDQIDPEPIANSEHAMAPFLSPDGGWVGFSRDGALVKVPIGGGAPVVLCATAGAVAATWLPDGNIVFGGELTRGLQRVASWGGTPEPFTTLDTGRGEIVHTLPEKLGDHGYLSFTVWTAERTEIAVVSVEGRDRRILGEGRQARFVAPGHLAFVRQGALWAAPLDLRRMALSGSPGPAVEAVDTSAVSGNAHFAVSDTGTLVYLPRRSGRSRERHVIWTDREGREEAAGLAPGPYTRAAVSRDGTRIALAASGPESRDLWLYSVTRGTLTRVTFDNRVDTAPVWTPDGRRLVFRSDREGGGLFVVGADGAGAPTRLTQSGEAIHTPYDVTRDGQHVLFTEFRTYRDQRIGMVPLEGSGTVAWLVDGPFAQLRPRLSPDGRWIAYQSDETGQFEVYVRPFPGVQEGRWQVSTNGGVSPMWGSDGRELFYFHDSGLLRVPITGAGTFNPGTPVRLFEIDVPSDRLGPTYDLSPDGRRFLFVKTPAAEAAAAIGPLQLVQNWHAALDERFPR